MSNILEKANILFQEARKPINLKDVHFIHAVFLFIYVLSSFICCDFALATDSVISRHKNTKILESEYISSPIGDNMYVEVYSFITDFLLTQPFVPTNDIEEFIKTEIDLLNTTDKPHIAIISEGEFASILRVLCYYKSECKQITLYQQNGIGVANNTRCNKTEDFNEQDLYIKIGVLGRKPKNRLGIHKFISSSGQNCYEIIQAIYYNQNEEYSYLSFDQINNNDKLIGYVRYIMEDHQKD